MSATAALLSGAVNQGMATTPFPGADNTQKLLFVYFSVTPAGNYAALGDTLDLTALADAIKSQAQAPLDVNIKSFNPAGNSGFIYQYVPGTDNSNGKFQVLTSNGAAPNPLVDLGAGAYPGPVLTDVILGCAVFVR
jgi:hypothetical protein